MKTLRLAILLCALLAANTSWASMDYSQSFDFSDSPVALSAGGQPLFLQVDLGQQFDSYEDIYIKINLLNQTKFITQFGLIFSNQDTPPSYAQLTEWGYAAMTTTTLAVTPSSTFSWNSGWSSEHWLSVGASEIANEIFDGKFVFYFQNAPLSSTPSLTFKDDIFVGSAEVTLRGANVSAVPLPASASLLAIGIVIMTFFLRQRNHYAVVHS